MEIGSVDTLVGELRQCQLLEPPQLDEVRQTLKTRFADPRALAGHLLKQGWLTPYQVNQLFQGRGGELVLGQYILQERIGDGGMGQVFKARHRRMKRLVDLVVLAEDLLARPEAQERFYREIQAASQLSHPHIVTAYDAGPIGHTHFFALEHVDGIDLDRLVKTYGAVDVPQACTWIRQAALGLQHGFDRGLLHHDLTPANLLAVRCAATAGDSGDAAAFGPLKIRNLGLTFLRQPTRGMPSNRGALACASPDFAAPEQSGQLPVSDVRSELYSLGCIFYFMLTGRVPFPSGSPVEKVEQHRTAAPVPVETYRSDVPPEVSQLLGHLLAKDPDSRFQTPGDVAAAFDALPVAQVAALRPGDTIALGPSARVHHDGPDTAGVSMRLASSVWAVRRKMRDRRWLWINVAGGMMLLVLCWVFFGLLYRQGSDGSVEAKPTESTTETRVRGELETLLPLLDDKQSDKAQLWQKLLTLRSSHPATPSAREVTSLLPRLPSALDDLEAAAVPGQGRPLWQPKDAVVGVLGEYQTHNRPYLHTFSLLPAQQIAALRGTDGTIQVMNLLSGKLLAAIKDGAGFRVNQALLSPDGKSLAVYGIDQSLKIWDLGTGQERCALPAKVYGGPSAFAFTPDGQSIATVLTDMTMLKVWDVSTATAREKNALQLTGFSAYAVACSPDGKSVAMSCSDRALREWEMGKDGMKLTIPASHPGICQMMLYAPDGKSLASLSSGQTQAVKVWDVESGKVLATVEQPSFTVNPAPHVLAFAPDGKSLAIIGNQVLNGAWRGQTILLWDVEKNSERAFFKRPPGPMSQFSLMNVGPKGRTVTTWSSDQVLRLWDTNSAQERIILKSPSTSLTSLALSPNCHTVVSGSPEGWLTLWDSNSAKPHRLKGNHTLAVKAVAFAPDGMTVASVGCDQAVRLWDVAQKSETQTVSGLTGYPTALTWSPDGGSLAVGTSEAAVTMYDPATRKSQGSLDGLTGWINALAYAPDCRTLASATSDGMVKLWSPSGGRARHELKGGVGGEALSLAFAPDGGTLAVGGSTEPHLRLWQVGSGAPRLGTALEGGHTGPVRGLSFSPDGKWLASVGDDCNVIVWKTATGKVHHKWLYGVSVHGVIFAPDGRHLLTLNEDGTAYVLRLTHLPEFKDVAKK